MAISSGKPCQGVVLAAVFRRAGESQNPVFQVCPGTLDRGGYRHGGGNRGGGFPSPQAGTRTFLLEAPAPRSIPSSVESAGN